MTRLLFAIAAVIAVFWSASADEGPDVRGRPPMIFIASGINADGNLSISNMEQRQKKVTQEVERDGKKTTVEGTYTYPVTVLNRQTVSLKGATMCDRDGREVSIDQVRERLKEPMPILITMRGEKVDPIYLKILSKDTLIITFASVPEFKAKSSPAGHGAGEPKRKAGVAVGEKVPDFSVRTLDGKMVKLSELQHDARRTKSGVAVLSFWCSTCGSCRRVERHLDKLAKDYEGQAAIVALDANAGETVERVTGFAKEKGLTLPIVLDPSGRTADLFGTDVTTTTVVIDGSGVLRYYGRFRDGDRAYAEDALKAVLAGNEVAVKTTPPDG